MKNLKVNKRLIAALLVTANMFCLNQDVYASEINLVEETKDLKDYVVALDNIKVYERPGGSVISNLEKGHTLNY